MSDSPLFDQDLDTSPTAPDRREPTAAKRRFERDLQDPVAPYGPWDTLAPIQLRWTRAQRNGTRTEHDLTPREVAPPQYGPEMIVHDEVVTVKEAVPQLFGTAARIYVIVIAALLAATLLPAAFGWSSRVIMTGSMTPVIKPGDVVVAQPTNAEQLRAGQIIVFADPVHPGRTLSHRFVKYDAEGLIVTKGDANAVEDSTHVRPSAVEGIVRLVVPAVGRPKVWLENADYFDLAAAVVLTSIASYGLRFARKKPKPEVSQPQQS